MITYMRQRLGPAERASRGQDYIAPGRHLRPTAAYSKLATSSSSSPKTAAASAAPAAAAAAAAADRATLADFVRWAVVRKVLFAESRVQKLDSSSGYGLFAVGPLNPGQRLCSCPRNVALTLKPGEVVVGDSHPWWAQLACKLALVLARSPPSNLDKDYHALLPDAVDLPVFWSDVEIQELQSSHIISKIMQEKENLRELTTSPSLTIWLTSNNVSLELYLRAVGLVRSRAFAGPHFTFPFGLKAGLAILLQLCVGGVVLSNSSMGIPLPAWEILAVGIPAGLAWRDLQDASTKTEYVIAPFLDLVNHSNRAATVVSYDWVKEAYQIVLAAPDAYLSGKEVFINYGDLSNDALLQMYGFVEEGANPNDRYIISDLAPLLLSALLSEGVSESSDTVAALPRKEVLEERMKGYMKRGILEEVMVTSEGFPAEIRQVAEDLVSRHAPHAGHAAVDVLKDALAREVSSLGTSLVEDQGRLAELVAQLQRAAELRAVDSQPKLDSAMSNSAHSDGAAEVKLEATQGNYVQGAGSPAEGDGHSVGMQDAEEGELDAERDLEAEAEKEAAKKAAQAELEAAMAERQEYDNRALALDAEKAGREQVWLKYRIAKKQVLAQARLALAA